MKTLPEILDYIQRDRLAKALGVGMPAIKIAERKGVAPSLWYDAMERLAGRPLDRSLFSFKAVRHDA